MDLASYFFNVPSEFSSILSSFRMGWGGVAYSIDLLLDGKKQPENIGVITG
jgi:hypothetical protein